MNWSGGYSTQAAGESSSKKEEGVWGMLWCLGLCHGNFIMEIFIQEKLNAIAGGSKEGRRILSEDVFHDLNFHFPCIQL